MRITAYLATTSFQSSVEILVIDDGSSDDTAKVAEQFAADKPYIRVLRNPGNRGKGYSIRHGMLASTGEWVLFTDADLSAPIEEVEKLLNSVKETQATVAIGSRALDRSLIGTHQSWFRENAGRLFNLLMRVFVGLPFWDTQCGFKLFSQKAATDVFSRQRIDGFGFDVEALFIAQHLGYQIVEVPVKWNHVDGTKLNFLSDSLKMFLDLLIVRWNSLLGRYR